LAHPRLEVADIFRRHGPAWRQANAGHVSLGQLKVMSAIESFRTAALGGHVARCENDKCGHTQIAYNSCRKPTLPQMPGSRCEGMARRAREAAARSLLDNQLAQSDGRGTAADSGRRVVEFFRLLRLTSRASLSAGGR
jgi:transposase-like zinc-binding protein